MILRSFLINFSSHSSCLSQDIAKKSAHLFSLLRHFSLSRLLTSTRVKMSSVEHAKKLAAYKAVDSDIKNNVVVGIGSGSTVFYAVEKIAEKVKNENLNVICIPSSFQAEHLITQNKLRLGNLSQNPVFPSDIFKKITSIMYVGVIGGDENALCMDIDVVIDGADEVDDNLTLIKGGGACLLREKIIASCADKMIIVADYTKRSSELGEKWKKGVPIEVVPMSYVPVGDKITKKFGGEIELRMAKMKCGPVVTDNGNFVLDWKFPEGQKYDWEKISSDLKLIPGVVETGLFVNLAKKAYFGMADGSVQTLG